VTVRQTAAAHASALLELERALSAQTAKLAADQEALESAVRCFGERTRRTSSSGPRSPRSARPSTPLHDSSGYKASWGD
jgi:hypothetical protein